MGTFLAPGASSLSSHRPCLRLGHRETPGGSRVSSAPARFLAPAPAAASTYRRSPGREWGRRLHARGRGAGSTMVPGAAAAAPRPLARRALSSSCKLSGSAVDKKPGRPSASPPGSGWGETEGGGISEEAGGRREKAAGSEDPRAPVDTGRTWLRESLQGSRDREVGPSQSLSTFPGILQSCNNKKRRGGGGRGGKGIRSQAQGLKLQLFI